MNFIAIMLLLVLHGTNVTAHTVAQTQPSKSAPCAPVTPGQIQPDIYLIGCSAQTPAPKTKKGCPTGTNGVRTDIYMVGCDNGTYSIDDLIDPQPLCSKTMPCVNATPRPTR